MMWWSGCVLLLASVCLAQQRPRAQPGASGEQQVRLEDIERDNLAATQKTSQQSSQQTQQQPTQHSLNQQQLAAFQQQLLLQQLQQQYFAPTPIAYGNFGGVPLMIVPSNQLGVGSPAGVPIQAYFVPAEPYFPQYQPQVYQPYPSQRAQTVPAQRLQPVPQDLTYNTLPVQQAVQQVYRQPQNYPSASIVYPGTPQPATLHQPQAYQQQQQQSQQQLYNAYNALYQQRQEKNSFGAGVKSTPAPPHKPQSQVYSSQQSISPTFSNYKNFNYNQ